MCRSGGVQGGLSNGENITIKVAFKPTSTIAKKQNTVSRDGEDVDLTARGRHDPCVVPRAVPMVEAMVALVLADQLMQVGHVCGRGLWACVRRDRSIGDGMWWERGNACLMRASDTAAQPKRISAAVLASSKAFAP